MEKIRILRNKNKKIELHDDYCLYIDSTPGQKETILEVYYWRKEGTKIILF